MTAKTPKKAKAPKKRVSKKAKNNTIESFMVHKFPCDGCLALNATAYIVNEPDLALHLHIGCLHHIATTMNNMGALVSTVSQQIEDAQAQTPPAPSGTPNKPTDPAYL